MANEKTYFKIYHLHDIEKITYISYMLYDYIRLLLSCYTFYDLHVSTVKEIQLGFEMFQSLLHGNKTDMKKMIL